MAYTTEVNSAKSLEEIIRKYEESTQSHFILKYSDKNFFDETPNTLFVSLKQRIRWSLNALTDQGIVLPFSGIPFIFLGNRTLSCHHGPDLNKSSKIKQRDAQVTKSEDSQTEPRPPRYLVQPTKKMDCPVVIHMKKLILFPQFKIDADSEYLRRVTGKLLRDAITGLESGCAPSELRVQLKYYVRLPDPNSHVSHALPEMPRIREPLRAVSGRNTKTTASDREDDNLTDTPVRHFSSSGVKVSPAGKASSAATATNFRELAELADDGTSNKTQRAATMIVKTTDGQEILVPVTEERRVRSALQRHINEKHSMLRLTDNQPHSDEQCQASEAESETQMAASQHAGEAADQQVNETGEGDNQQVDETGEGDNQQVDEANQQVSTTGEEAIQQVDVAGEVAEEQTMYTDDDVIQYVTSVDLSYYNQHQTTTQQQLQQLSYFIDHPDAILELTISKLAARYAKIDQEQLFVVIRELKSSDDSVLLMPSNVRLQADVVVGSQHVDRLRAAELCDIEDAECKIEVPNADLMFVYQSTHMKQVYRRYGHLLMVLDAVYRGGRYPLPVYFLHVRTNTNYQIVAVIIVQQETQRSLVNALQVVRRWNPDVSPRYALIDLSEEELAAIQETFPGVEVYIGDYHREQAWQRWLDKVVHSMDTEGIKTKLRRIANALTVEDVDRTLMEFESSPAFTSSSRLGNWFSNTWKPHLIRWTLAYRSAECLFLMYTNNGTRNMNEDFRYEFLDGCYESPLSQLVTAVIKELPSLADIYMELNVRSSSLYRKYNDDVPLYLRNRPRRVVDDVRKKMRAVQSDDVTGVCAKAPGVFLVPARGGRPPHVHEVVFGSDSSLCSCTCQSFQRTQMLCTHFFAVFQALPNWTFDHVSPIYTQSPLLMLDEDILTTVAASSTVTAAADGTSLSKPSTSMSPPVNNEKLLKSERQRARSLLQDMFEMTYRVDDINLIRKLVQCVQPVHREMSDCAVPDTQTPPDSAIGRSGKRKLQFKRSMLPASKKQPVMLSDGGHVNVMEVHVINTDVSNSEQQQQQQVLPAVGPTFTV